MAHNSKIQAMTLKEDQRYRDLGYRMHESAFKGSCLGQNDQPPEVDDEDDEVKVSIDSPIVTENHYHQSEPVKPLPPNGSAGPVPSKWGSVAKTLGTGALAVGLGFGGMALANYLWPGVDTRNIFQLVEEDGTLSPPSSRPALELLPLPGHAPTIER